MSTPAVTHPLWPKQADVPAYFGKIETGDNGLPTERWERTMLTQIALPCPLRLSWEPETIIHRLSCHRAVARALTFILADIFALYKNDRAGMQAARMDLFGGCYNFRRMRGGANLSMHSYGIAIDLDPDRNPQGKPWVEGKGMMPGEVVDIFLAHGWTWGGLWKKNPDAMHFQATQPL